MSTANGVGIVPPQPKRCPLCGATVPPDALGLYQCSCGWGGPDDPLEHDRGLAKLVARTDRNLADGQAWRDLRRLATHGDAASSLNILYLALLLLTATFIYLLILAVVALCIWLIVSTVLDQTWIGAIVGGILLALIIASLWPHRRSHKGIPVTRERFPALLAALDEVSQRTGVRVPKRIMLWPGDDFSIGRRLADGDSLNIGVVNLPLLSDIEMKSLLAHELAHSYQGYTAVHRYCAQAERLLHEVVYGILEGVVGQSYGAMRRTQRWVRSGGDGMSSVGFIGLVFTWTFMLPFRIVWSGFHLLRMHESRVAEFSADRAAIHAYGPQAFINGLTALEVARRTFYKNGNALRGEMARHNNQDFYAEMRRHYNELPPQVISQLRVESTKGFRTLANSHPTTPDRLRAAYATFGTLPPSPATTRPAYMLLTPAGATDAEAVEIELTKMLFNPKKK
ncbi:MAG TPA: M48 family metalloprotease [Ktedonobacterales bacterium]|nr:M48 family metalloprotease [Ktedonobacterales bacterium]